MSSVASSSISFSNYVIGLIFIKKLNITEKLSSKNLTSYFILLRLNSSIVLILYLV